MSYQLYMLYKDVIACFIPGFLIVFYIYLDLNYDVIL